MTSEQTSVGRTALILTLGIFNIARSEKKQENWLGKPVKQRNIPLFLERVAEKNFEDNIAVRSTDWSSID